MAPEIPAGISLQLSRVTTVLRAVLGDHIEGMILFGSAVDGGLKPHSDIDVLVLVHSTLSSGTRREIVDALLLVSAPPGDDPDLRAVEVTVLRHDDVHPWRYPPTRELQFGEWERAEIDAGHYPRREVDPDLAIILTKARRHNVVLHGPSAEHLLPVVPTDDLLRALSDTIAQWQRPQDWEGDELTVVLALARLWFTAETGDIAAKDAAASWALARLPDHLHPLLRMARAIYLGDARDELSSDPNALEDLIRALRVRVERALDAP